MFVWLVWFVFVRGKIFVRVVRVVVNILLRRGAYKIIGLALR
jgi:hypothetical protein